MDVIDELKKRSPFVFILLAYIFFGHIYFVELLPIYQQPEFWPSLFVGSVAGCISYFLHTELKVKQCSTAFYLLQTLNTTLISVFIGWSATGNAIYWLEFDILLIIFSLSVFSYQESNADFSIFKQEPKVGQFN